MRTLAGSDGVLAARCEFSSNSPSIRGRCGKSPKNSGRFQRISKLYGTVDGQNSAPPGMYKTL